MEKTKPYFLCSTPIHLVRALTIINEKKINKESVIISNQPFELNDFFKETLTSIKITFKINTIFRKALKLESIPKKLLFVYIPYFIFYSIPFRLNPFVRFAHYILVRKYSIKGKICLYTFHDQSNLYFILKKYSVKNILVEDGSVNYLAFKAPFYKYLGRLLNGVDPRIRYMGEDIDVDKILLTNPELSPTLLKNKVDKFPLRENFSLFYNVWPVTFNFNFSGDKRVFVICAQPFHEVFPLINKIECFEFYKYMVVVVKRNIPDVIVILKPHPRQSIDDLKFLTPLVDIALNPFLPMEYIDKVFHFKYTALSVCSSFKSEAGNKTIRLIEDGFEYCNVIKLKQLLFEKVKELIL